MKDYLIISLLYTVCGILSLVACLALLLVYVLRPPKFAYLFYPGRILLNINLINFLLALRFFLVGIMGDLGDATTHTHSFGLLNYDCLFEGLFAFACFLFLTGWNIIWLVDLWYATRNPRHLADDISAYYMIFIYFIGMMIAFITFFSLERTMYGSSDWTFTCFVNDGVFYYSIVNSLLGIYGILGLFFLFRRQPRRLSSQFSITNYIRLKKYYILMFLLSNIWGIAFQASGVKELQYIFVGVISLQPGLFSLLWLVPYIRARLLFKRSP